ncbi:MAG: CatB-related O-acetyltransferase [Oscillospiraceae bacterium]|nr:CatB-related O-acetyltransferase [Oscillospiraceae bacterium]
MKSKIEQVLERCLNHRDIIIWGTPTRLLSRTLKAYKTAVADDVNPEKHFVITVTEDDLIDFKQDEQSRAFSYVKDYFSFSDYGRSLPFEWDCYAAKIGRQTYFGEKILWSCGFGYIKSIGRYTSINNSAAVYGDHQMDMCFVSDQLQSCFSEENKALYQEKISSNPKNPYGKHNDGIIIGNDVWIGANAFINASKVVSIGDGAIIGSGAVVLEDVPPYAIVVGAPANIKRYRYSPEIIECLLRVKWWDWSIEEINANADALMSPDIFIKKFAHHHKKS